MGENAIDYGTAEMRDNRRHDTAIMPVSSEVTRNIVRNFLVVTVVACSGEDTYRECCAIESGVEREVGGGGLRSYRDDV